MINKYILHYSPLSTVIPIINYKYKQLLHYYAITLTSRWPSAVAVMVTSLHALDTLHHRGLTKLGCQLYDQAIFAQHEERWAETSL